MDKPSWLELDGNTMTLDANAYYPVFLAEMGIEQDAADKQDLETALRFAGWTARMYLSFNGLDPRVSNPEGGLRIVRKGDKAKWAIANRPAGKGEGKTPRDMRMVAAEEWKNRRHIAVPS